MSLAHLGVGELWTQPEQQSVAVTEKKVRRDFVENMVWDSFEEYDDNYNTL